MTCCASHPSIIRTISTTSHSLSVTPAAIAGLHFRVLVDADEIVSHEVQRHRVGVVLGLLAERIRQPE